MKRAEVYTVQIRDIVNSSQNRHYDLCLFITVHTNGLMKSAVNIDHDLTFQNSGIKTGPQIDQIYQSFLYSKFFFFIISS